MNTNLILLVFVIFCSSLFSTCNSIKVDEFEITFPNVDPDLPEDFQCHNPGIACDCNNLTYVYFCLNQGGKLVPEVIDVCSNDEVCIESSQGCDKGPNPECNKEPYDMQCTSDGIFPDPYDCRKYYVCAPSENGTSDFDAHANACFGEYGFDPLSGYCKQPLGDGGFCLNQPIPSCTKASGVQLIPSNPYMYYICVKVSNGYQPLMFRCPHQENTTPDGCNFNLNTIQ